MHLQRNFVWSLDLSDRELKVIVKALQAGGLSEAELTLAAKLGDTLAENAARLERLTAGKKRRDQS